MDIDYDGTPEGKEQLLIDFGRKGRQKIYRSIFKVIRNPSVVEELVQDVYMRAWRVTGRESDYKAELDDGNTTSFGTWMYKVASNIAIDYLRKKRIEDHAFQIDKPIPTADGNVGFQIPDTSNDPGADFLRSKLRYELETTIASMKPTHKRVTVLRDVEGFSYEDIADILGDPIGTVKARIFRARELMKRGLKKYETEMRSRADFVQRKTWI
ncbi:MAG: sigma-70 family RNA polymerase sigma factor [Candidatus Aenigmatarchaeota archaeon]